MYYHRISNSQADPTFLENASDILHATTRHLIYLICIVIFIWQMTSGLIWYDGRPIRLLPASLLALTCGVLALLILERHLFLAQLLVLLGFASAIFFYTIVLDQAQIAYSLSLLPLLAVIMMGWLGGIAAELIVVLELALLPQFFSGSGLPPVVAALTIINSAVAGIAGFIGMSSLLTITQWAVFSYKEAEEKMELARDRQMNLLHVQEDLIHANNELARMTERMKVVTLVAEEARRIKEEFVANVSHELRTPLNLIIGFSETIIQAPGMYKTRLPAKLMADISAIHRNSQQLVELINDVLDLSQIEAGRMELHKGWYKLDRIIEDSVQSVQSLFSSKNLYLEIESGPADLEIYCDETRIREVLLNLLINAGRFTEQGGVRVRWWLNGEKVIVAICDTGPGIDPEDSARLFQPFQQLDSSLNRRWGGSGLGLSISRRFVELHNGQMWLESVLGSGSTFYFSLPFEITPQTRSAARAPLRWINEYAVHETRERPFEAPKPVLRPRFVILEQGSALQKIFRPRGEEIELHCTAQPQEALAEIKHSPTQALIVNCASTEALPLDLSEVPYDTPVITCYLPDTNDISRDLGVLRYLVKPVTRTQVLKTVAQFSLEGSDILVVDDNSEELQLFVRMLESAGMNYRVLRATSGAQASEMMRNRHIDLVLLDIKMEGISGLDVLAEKRRDPQIRDIPVIIISSQDPTGGNRIEKSVKITRSGGLTTADFMECVLALTKVLSPISLPPAPKPEAGSLAEPASE